MSQRCRQVLRCTRRLSCTWGAVRRLTRRCLVLFVGGDSCVRAEGSMCVRSRRGLGTRAPSVPTVLEALTATTGETIAAHGAAVAILLGLTTQVPVRTVYLTSGPSRRLSFGAQTVELQHAPRWQLSLAGRPAGDAIRALAWLGRGQSRAMTPRLGKGDLDSDAQRAVGGPGTIADVDGPADQYAGPA
jgi:hypothetical protein